MADVTVVKDFPAYGKTGYEDPVYDASSTVGFMEYGVEKYRMDIVREYNQTLGFGVDGSFKFVLRMAKGDVQGDEVEYFNTSTMVEAQKRGTTWIRPGPIAAVEYWLHNSTYVSWIIVS